MCLWEWAQWSFLALAHTQCYATSLTPLDLLNLDASVSLDLAKAVLPICILYVTSTTGLDDRLPQTFLRQLVQTSAAPLPPPPTTSPASFSSSTGSWSYSEYSLWPCSHPHTSLRVPPLPNAAILAPERQNVLELLTLIPNSNQVRTFPNVPTHADYFTIAFKCSSVCFLFSVCNSVIDFPLLHSLLESWQTYSIANWMLEFINAVLVQRCAVCWFSAPPIPRCP